MIILSQIGVSYSISRVELLHTVRIQYQTSFRYSLSRTSFIVAPGINRFGPSQVCNGRRAPYQYFLDWCVIFYVFTPLCMILTLYIEYSLERQQVSGNSFCSMLDDYDIYQLLPVKGEKFESGVSIVVRNRIF